MASNATSGIVSVRPYLAFLGRTEEALAFYEKVLGAQVTFKMRFNESPEPCDPQMVAPGTEHKILHSEFVIGGATLMASDGGCSEMAESRFDGITLTIATRTSDDAERIFNDLGVGGKVQMPLMKTFFSPKFGMVQDRFGVGWIVLVDQPQG